MDPGSSHCSLTDHCRASQTVDLFTYNWITVAARDRKAEEEESRVKPSDNTFVLNVPDQILRDPPRVERFSPVLCNGLQSVSQFLILHNVASLEWVPILI